MIQNHVVLYVHCLVLLPVGPWTFLSADSWSETNIMLSANRQQWHDMTNCYTVRNILWYVLFKRRLSSVLDTWGDTAEISFLPAEVNKSPQLLNTSTPSSHPSSALHLRSDAYLFKCLVSTSCHFYRRTYRHVWLTNDRLSLSWPLLF